MIKKMLTLFYVIVILFLSGCATIEQVEFSPTDTKDSIQSAWKRSPDRIYTHGAKLKYGADEVWDYEYLGGGTIDRFYFRGDIVIKVEHIIYGDF